MLPTTPRNDEQLNRIDIPEEYQEVFLAKLSDAGQIVFPAQLRENTSVTKWVPSEYLARPGDKVEIRILAIRRPGEQA